MRLKSLVLITAVQLAVVGQEKPPEPPGREALPKDIDAEEQVVLLAARVKSLAEVQDLVLKQQQLILQHLEALRTDIEALRSAQTNQAAKADFQTCLSRIDLLQKQFQAAQETNQLTIARLVHDVTVRDAEGRANGGTNALAGFRFEPYKVVAGDTLSKIVIRVNDTLERRNLARVSQEQLERANPGLSPDKIRVGQTLLIPLLDKP